MRDIDVRMVVVVERSSFCATPDGYFYVIARPRKMEWDDGESDLMPYGTFWRHEGDPFYENLEVRCQGNIESGEMYAFSVEYRPVAVTLSDAEEIVKVLRSVRRKMDRANADLGYPQTFPEFLARASQALGIGSYGFRKATGEKWMDGSTFRWGNAMTLDYQINSRVKAIREQAGVKVAA